MPVEDMSVERFRTMLAITSGIMNRWPITKVSSDKNDDEILTPMHFLFPGGYPFARSHDVLPQIPDGGSSLRGRAASGGGEGVEEVVEGVRSNVAEEKQVVGENAAVGGW